MCFSAEASFVTGSALLVTGIISVNKAPEIKQLIFASIPLIFSIQQFTEGFLWLALQGNSYTEWKNFLTHIFLAIAHVVWPIWIPLSFYILAKDSNRKKILFTLLVTGILVSLFLFYCLFVYPIEARITAHHIFYEINYPHIIQTGSVLYIIATILPAFISDMRWARIFGLLNLSSFIISKWMFKDHVISVWCFMAAAMSVVVLVIVLRNFVSRENI